MVMDYNGTAFRGSKVSGIACNGNQINGISRNGDIIYKKKGTVRMLYGNKLPYMPCNNFAISKNVSFSWEMGGIMYPFTDKGEKYNGHNGRSHWLGLQRRIMFSIAEKGTGGELQVALGASGIINTGIKLDDKYHVYKFCTNTTTGTPKTWHVYIDGIEVYSHTYDFNSATGHLDFYLWNWFGGSSQPARQALEYVKLIRNKVTLYDLVPVAKGEKPNGASKAATFNTMFNKVDNSYMSVSNAFLFRILTEER